MPWNELFTEVREYQPGQEKLDLPTSGGVYLLTDEQDRLIQLASTADLRHAILNRLASPREITPTQQDESSLETQQSVLEPAPPTEPTPAVAPASVPTTSRRRADLSQIVRRIRWQPTHSVFEATYEYCRIARVILPDTYLDNVAFGPAWFVHADPAATIPRFTVGKWVPSAYMEPPDRGRPGSPGESIGPPGSIVTLGPFATQADANKFMQVLEDVFDLCRYVYILEQAPHGQACAYFEMGRCPAPCNGSIPMSQYRQTILTALSYAAGERDQARREWEEKMRQAAASLEFEKAAAIKQRLERAREIDRAAYRYVRPIEEFSWLVLQRGGGRTRVKPFFVRGGWVEAGDVIKLKDIEHTVPIWLAHIHQPRRPDSVVSWDQLSEHIWLVSHFLFRRERAGLFLHVSELTDVVALVEQIRETFERAKPSANDDSANGHSAGITDVEQGLHGDGG